MRDHLFYVAKVSNDRFKFGISRNIKGRLNNLITTGYGRVTLIGESTKACSKMDALYLESLIKKATSKDGIKGEYCTTEQVKSVVKTIKESYGFQYHNDINIDVGTPVALNVNEKIALNITPGVIKETTDVCTSSTSQCVLAVAAMRQGFSRPDFQANKGKFTKDGIRYTCLLSNAACETLLQFDEDKSKLTPRTVNVEIVKIEPVKTRSYNTRSKGLKFRRKAKPRRTRGRDKGLVKYFKTKQSRIH